MNKLSFTLLLFAFSVNHLFAQPSGFNFGKRIEISASLVSGSNDLQDFPVFINLTDPDLRSIANGGHIQNNNGFDITFTLPDCISSLFFQIEDYNPTNGHLTAWVRIPALSPVNNTEIFMYYGNSSISINPSSTSTWNADFDGTWHMDNNPSSTTLTDYSGNGVNGTSFGNMTTSDLVGGKLGNAIDLDGSNDYFALANKSFTNPGEITELTVSAWVNTTYSANSAHSNWSIVDFDRSEYFNMFIHGDGRLGFATRGVTSGINDSYAGNVGQLNDGDWHYVVGVYNGTSKLLYIDGVLSLTVNNPHGGTSLGSGANRFGFIGDGSEASSFNGNRNNIYYDGMYDEIHLLNSSLSSDWISTEYNNQNNPMAFYSLTSEFTAEDLCLLLPVEFGVVNATLKSDRYVDVTWNTITEIDNDYFEVQRSKNGFDWEIIDIVDGAGNSTEELHYSSIDFSPRLGSSYYRIKQVDYNGDYKYSAIKTVIRSNKSDILVYPNPTRNFVIIQGIEDAETEISITNKLGQSVLHKVDLVENSSNSIQLNLSDLKTGMYFITIGNITQRVTKQ